MRRALIMVMLFALALSMVQLSNVNAQETFLWGAEVSSSGLPTTSPVLEAGRQYRITAHGVFYYGPPLWLAADAQYFTTDPVHDWNWYNHFPAPDGHSFLQINGMDVNWGPFSNGVWLPDQGDYIVGHEYSINYVGAGAPITFTIVDWIDETASNNICHLHVEIYESPLCNGYTPGFWKHNIGVALGYNPGNYSAFNDGTKLTLAMLQGYAATVGVTLEEAYAAVSARGNREGQAQIRADMANAFNAAAGYGPFVDED